MLSEEVRSYSPSDGEDSADDHRNLIFKYKITLEIEKRNSDIQKLETLLTELKDIDSPDANDNDNTLIHFAVKVGNSTAVELLLKNGASINITNNKGQTPLQVAKLLCHKKFHAKKKIIALLKQSQEGKDSKETEARMSDNGPTEVQPVQTDEKIYEPADIKNPERATYLLSEDDIEKGNSEDIMKKINELFGHEMSFASNIKKQQILQEIVNEAYGEDGNTALILCAKNKDSEKLKLFLNLEADVNKINKKKMRASDYSWLNRDYISLLELYNKGSHFPKECSATKVENDHEHEKDLKTLISKWENKLRENSNDTIVKLQREFHKASKEERLSLLWNAIDEGREEEMKLVLNPPLGNNTEPNLLNKPWDEEGNTPLILSAIEKDLKKLKYLLNIGAEAAKKNFRGYGAIEYSWENEDYFSVLELLKKDSYFHPYGVKPENVNKEKAGGKLLSEFIISRNVLHEAIKEGNLEKVKCITKNQKSELFLSSSNKSAIFCAVENKQLSVHAFLLSKGAGVTNNENDKYMMYMSDEYKRRLNAMLDEYIFEPEDSLAKKLSCKSICFGENGESNETILSFYKELEKSEYILPILKVLQFHLNLLIIFSLNCRSTKNKDIDDPDGIKGSTDFINGQIHIAAKDSNMEGGQRHEVLGTLAHEMAHQAIYLTYNNQCNPYLKEENDSAAELEEITMEVCESIFRTLLKKKVERMRYTLQMPQNDWFLERTKVVAMQTLREIKSENNQKFKDMIDGIDEKFITDLLKEEDIDPIITAVYTCYKREYWHRELIVRVPHMIGKYGESTGKEKLMKQVPKLFEYYKKNVIPRMNGFLGIGSNLMSKKEAMEILIMNENLGIMKAIDAEKIWLKNPSQLKPLFHSYRVFKMVKTSSIKLCTIYFYQILRDQYKNYFHMQCVFINMYNFEHNIKKILHLAKSEACKAIVLISDSSLCDIKNLADSFLESRTDIYVILNDKYPENFETMIFEWPLFTEESKKTLMNKKIKFYGSTFTLFQLLNFNEIQSKEIIFSKFLDSEALAILVEEKDLNIDDESESHLLEYDSEYYIERYFCKQAIQKDILSEESKEYTLYITNASTEDLFSMNVPKGDIQELNNGNIRLGRRILIKSSRTNENDQSIFCKIKDKCNNLKKIVHWLNMENGFLIWKDSNGKIGNLEKFVDADKKVKCGGEIIAEKSKKIVILADMPGMGKSTILSKLQEELKVKKYWTLRFHLVDLVKKLSQSDINQMKEEKMPPENAINIIACIKFINPLIKSIFKICCNTQERIVLIFDGLDEVQNEFRKPIINLIKSLMSSQIMQIWISARSNEKAFLERELQVMAFTLNNWDTRDQIDFANKLWNKKLNSLNKDMYAEKCHKLKDAILSWRSNNQEGRQSDETSQTDGFPEDISMIGVNCNSIDFSKFLEHIISQLNDELKKFVSIPLHTLILASVIFEKNFRIDKGLNIYEMYKHFIQQTFQRYYEKCQLDFKNCIFLQQLLSEKLLTASQCIVRDNLRLDENFFHQEINENNNLEKILDCFDKIGLLSTSGQFFHQNIAEYLLVEWIFVNSGVPAVQKFCVDTILMKENFSVVRQFISSKIEFMGHKNKTYSNGRHFLFELDAQEFFKPKKVLSILERIIAEGLDSLLKFFLEIFPQDMLKATNSINKKKQNILHLSCYHGKCNILNIILKFIKDFKKGDEIKKEESFFNMEDKMNVTPFLYAIKTGDKELVESFLTNMEGIFDPGWAKKNLILLANNSSNSALHTAVSMRNIEVLKFLWQKIKDYEMSGEKCLKSILEKRHQRSKNAITHSAAYNGCSWLINEIFKVLIEVNDFSSEYLRIKNDSGFTVLHAAVLSDDVAFLADVISTLGENVEKAEWRDFLITTDNWKDTALHKSAYRSHTKTIKILLDFSKNALDKNSLRDFLFLPNNKGYTALHKSVFYSTYVYFEEYWDKLKFLLGDKLLLDLVKVCNNYGNTILHTAASVGNLDIVRKLCEFLNEKDENNFILEIDSDKDTVLHKASIKGQIDVLLYVANFVKMNMRKDFTDLFCKVNKNGNSVLHLAVRFLPSDHSDILEFARINLTEEQFEKFRYCKNTDGDTFQDILDKKAKANIQHS